MPTLHDLFTTMGQSAWLDSIRRAMFSNGEFDALLERGVRGMTSNPSIFEHAISTGEEYTADIMAMIQDGLDDEAIYEHLALDDIRQACDRFLPLYIESKGQDGYVSLEVSPRLSRDTDGTVEAAKRLFELIGKPNAMIKIPATTEGVRAIQQCTALGININATLIFTVPQYIAVAYAFIDGACELGQKGPTVPGGRNASEISSVASLFISRLDNAATPLLEKAGETELIGEIAIANAIKAYAEYRRFFEKPGAPVVPVQRLLFASTSTKDKRFPDTLYIDRLVAPNTVNTMPPATMDAFVDHGSLDTPVPFDAAPAEALLQRAKRAGVNVDEIGETLQQQGLDSFANAYESLLGSIAAKRK